MSENTTIQVEKDLLEELKKEKRYKMQTYSEFLREMLKVYRSHKSQYDEFLHKIQQEKMAELWDNKDDAGWENV